MKKDYLAMVLIIALIVFLLLVFVKKEQIRTAFFAFMLAQLFSWVITLLNVQFGIQTNPVRLFPHATESNFLFAFFFHPAIFTIYYLHYPKKAVKMRRILYSVILVALPVLFQLFISMITKLVFVPNKLTLLGSYVMILFLYSISRIYIDRYLVRLHNPERNEK